MTRYVIIGAGAVGITLAAELQASGRDVVIVGRGRQLDLLRAGAVRYLTPDGSRPLSVTAVGHPDEVRLDSRDVLVLATKSQDAHGVLALWSRQPVGPGGQRAGEVLPVFTPQNGLDAERAALRLFATVVGSVLVVPSTYVDDGEVLSPGAPAAGLCWLGSYPDGLAGAAARAIAADLSAARFEVQVVPDLSRWKAAKLVISSAFVLDALFEPGTHRDRAARLAQAEARAVLEAAGWSIADTVAESTLRLDRFGIAPVPGHERPGSSTYQSLARGKDVETDYLNGEIVLLARELGRRAPLQAALQARAQRVVQEGGAPGRLTAADLAASLARTGVLLDARAGERYRGESEPIDPRAGHIPGALSRPTGDNLGPDGRFRPAAELRARFADLPGNATVGVYCGSGVTAAHEVAALQIAGIDAVLFPGSWSAWSADPGRPAATGAQPG